ncbi:MAG: hypothetical protein ACUVV6_02965 [Thermoplasmatota archaeon]
MKRATRWSFVIWAAMFMVIASWAAVAGAAAEEGGADGRLTQPVPQWKVGNYWRYSFSARPTQYNLQVSHDIISVMTGTIDYYNHYLMQSIDSTWYRVSYVSERWENGTYYWTDGHVQTPPAPYRNYEKLTTSAPMKYRTSDIAEGDYTLQWEGSANYEWTSIYKFANYTGSGSYQYTYSNGAIAWYKFPLSFGSQWNPSGTMVNHWALTINYEPDTQGQSTTRVYNIDETYRYTSILASVQSTAYETQTTAAGYFTDCFKIWIRGTFDWSATGTISQTGSPTQNINQNQPGVFTEEWRWYSNTAGNVVNYNSTSSTTGLLLTSYQYVSIPPNYKPEVKTIAGQQHTPGMSIPIREDELASIEITVLDEDMGDGLNWTVLEVTPSPTNPAGAKLMDTLPTFSSPNPTAPDFNRIHTNKLLITPKQPKTNDRDEYTIKVNVDDGRDEGSMNFTFRVRVLNVNDKPQVAQPVPDVWVKENSTMTCTTWRLTDIFKDPDLEAGIAEERLTFSAVVTAGPQLDIDIEDSTGTVTLVVPDYAFSPNPPTTWESSVKFTATDAGSGNPANKTSNSTTGRIRVEHINHDPILSANGTELLEEGLVWAEDTTDTRLDLNKVFKDYDTTYAGDALSFSFSGNRYISVKNSGGKVTLTPERDWSGRETIKFKAMDSFGRSKDLRLECEVYPVNDAPSFCETEMDITWEDEEALTIKEATGPTGTLNKLLLSISVRDPDIGDTHSCVWYVNDSEGNVVHKSGRPVPGDDDYEFECAWTGPRSASGSPYEVKVVVIDQKGATAVYIWNLTVLNVNRLPVITLTSPQDNQSFMKGKTITFDAWSSKDPDESTGDGLTFTWTSSKQGLLKQDRGQLGAQFALNNLKAGTHIITLRVMDSDGGESEYTFTIKVKEPSTTPGFETPVLLATVAAGALFVGARRRK